MAVTLHLPMSLARLVDTGVVEAHGATLGDVIAVNSD